MLVNNLGYIFECRQDPNGSYGVMESFKVMFRENEQRVTIVLAVDSNGKIVAPSHNDISLGFKPLNVTHNSKELIEKFVKSNKPYFGKLGDFAMIAAGTIIYNRETKELISADGIDFYVPTTMSNCISAIKDSKGNQQPALICEKLSTSAGLNLFKVSKQIKDAYLKGLISGIDAKAAEDRNTFLCSIVLKE